MIKESLKKFRQLRCRAELCAPTAREVATWPCVRVYRVDGSRRQAYDEENRLKEVALPGGLTVNYMYPN